MDEAAPAEAKADETVESGAQAEEEEETADFDDPLAMLGGMGQEEVYKVTLMDEAAPAEANADEKDGAGATDENQEEPTGEEGFRGCKENDQVSNAESGQASNGSTDKKSRRQKKNEKR